MLARGCGRDRTARRVFRTKYEKLFFKIENILSTNILFKLILDVINIIIQRENEIENIFHLPWLREHASISMTNGNLSYFSTKVFDILKIQLKYTHFVFFFLHINSERCLLILTTSLSLVVCGKSNDCSEFLLN